MTPTPPSFAPWLGVFETVRVQRGQPLFFAEHLSEMQRAMVALGIEADLDLDSRRRTLPASSGRWRWIARPGSLETIFSEEVPARDKVASLSISPIRVGSVNWDARFKTLSYLAHAQAAILATTDEVVLLNEAGNVASGSHGNLFWRRGGELFTPAYEAGCRRGVVRGFVLKTCDVHVGHFPFEDLRSADEILFTNSMRGIVSIGSFEGRTTPFCDESGEKLRAAYSAETNAQLTSSAD